MSYDDLYQRTKNAFGSGPDKILRDYLKLIHESKPVLDVGAGQGRNALYLARKGYQVVAIDPSKAAIDAIAKTAIKKELPIQIHLCGIENFSPRTDYFSGILLFGIIQVLTWEAIENLLEKVTKWTQQGSLAFVTAFSTEDPAVSNHKKKSESAGKNSYILGEMGGVHTYLEKNEILDLFLDWDVLHHWEGLGPKHKHGSGPLQRHGMVEAVFKR